MNRREFFLSSAGLMVQMQGFKPNLIVRSDGPIDLETPLSTLDKAWLLSLIHI